jgi:hypothetical protein
MIVDLEERDWYLITKLLEFHSLKIPAWMGVELTSLQRIIEAQLKGEIREQLLEADILECLQRPLPIHLDKIKPPANFQLMEN